MIPAPPVFTVTPVKRPVSQSKVTEQDNKIEDRVRYLLSAIKQPLDLCIIVCLHDSEPVIQVGPTCGLVAISMASKLVHGQIVEQASPSELLLKARQLKYTKQGEIFSAENLLKLSLDHLQCSGTLISFDNANAIISLILKRSTIIFPYDCDKNHMPCKLKGHKAHWALSVGCAISISSKEMNNYLPFCESKGDYYLLDMAKLTCHITDSIVESATLNDTWLFCRHGKSRHIGLWPLKDIVESNSNLLELEPDFNPDNCVMPAGGIQDGLCGKAVLLEK